MIIFIIEWLVEHRVLGQLDLIEFFHEGTIDLAVVAFPLFIEEISVKEQAAITLAGDFLVNIAHITLSNQQFKSRQGYYDAAPVTSPEMQPAMP